MEASTSEPEPVVSWRTVIALVGWLTLLTGIFLSKVDCSSLLQTSCTTRLTLTSTTITVVGALLLGRRMADRRKGDKTPIRTSVKMLATYLLILPGLAVLIAIALFLVFLGLPPGLAVEILDV